MSWRSGWLGVEAYGLDTVGFADVHADRDGSVEAEIHWMAGTGEVHTPFRLRHDPGAGSVELLANFDDETEPGWDDDEDTGSSGWSVESATHVPADLAPLLSADTLDRAFGVMAALHPGMFAVLDDADDCLSWDHHWLPGPGPDELWRPLDEGRETWPIANRSGTPSAEAGSGS